MACCFVVAGARAGVLAKKGRPRCRQSWSPAFVPRCLSAFPSCAQSVSQPVGPPPTLLARTPVAGRNSRPTIEHTRITDTSVLYHTKASIYSPYFRSAFVARPYVPIRSRPSALSAWAQPPTTPTKNLLCLATDAGATAFRYEHVEQWLAASMADLADEAVIARRIRSPRVTPTSARRLGRAVAAVADGAPWVAERVEVAFVGCLAKFAADPALAAALVATAAGPAGPRRLVGASLREREWGVGLSMDDPGVEDPASWQGDNLLGVVLERVREVLLAQGAA